MALLRPKRGASVCKGEKICQFIREFGIEITARRARERLTGAKRRENERNMSKMRIETREGNEPKAQRGGVFAVLRTLRSQRKADEVAETAGAVEVAETAEVTEADGAAEVVEAKGGFDGTLPAPVDFNGDGIVSRNAPRQLDRKSVV